MTAGTIRCHLWAFQLSVNFPAHFSSCRSPFPENSLLFKTLYEKCQPRPINFFHLSFSPLVWVPFSGENENVMLKYIRENCSPYFLLLLPLFAVFPAGSAAEGGEDLSVCSPPISYIRHPQCAPASIWLSQMEFRTIMSAVGQLYDAGCIKCEPPTIFSHRVCTRSTKFLGKLQNWLQPESCKSLSFCWDVHTLDLQRGD